MADFIEGSWHWSGPWLMCDRAIARDQNLNVIGIGIESAPFCPECLSDSTVRLRLDHQQFPYCFYCRNCGLVWLPYAVRCPEHPSKSLYNLHCHECDYDWDEELIKEMHEKGW